MRFGRIARRLAGGLFFVGLAVITALGLGVVIPRPFLPSAPSGKMDQEAKRQVLVLANPIHTDIALPADPDVLGALSFVSAAGLDLDFPGVHWVIVGWGSRSFYIGTPTWADLKPGPVLRAFTWDASVMHVRRAGQISTDHEDVLALDLSRAEFDALLSGIAGSFQREGRQPPVAIAGASYDEHDLFFPAKGGFNALTGCNTWTARMLRRAGLQTGIWTPLPWSLDWSLHLHNRLGRPVP